jgi:hypothetical protein
LALLVTKRISIKKTSEQLGKSTLAPKCETMLRVPPSRQYNLESRLSRRDANQTEQRVL